MRGEDEIVTDYLDGRLAPAERSAFQARLETEPRLARRLRLTRALKTALPAAAPRMPDDLRAALKARIRESEAREAASPWARVRAALTGAAPWGCGVGMAFVAAALTLALAVRRSPRPRPGGPAWTDAAVSQGLKELWTADDGRDAE